MLRRLLREPPFRLVGKFAVRHLRATLASQVFWESADRPQYAAGLLLAAHEARRSGVSRISAIEFGVAQGDGLLALEKLARLAAAETGVEIRVFGFDLASGLPEPEDYRDHPERWHGGQYPMNRAELRARLRPGTELVLGDVAETVPAFLGRGETLGFAAFDLDLYRSTHDALGVLDGPALRHAPLYFDEVLLPESHRWAGELLAIREFNERSAGVKIDRLRGLETAFPESPWLRAMYCAHRIGD